MKIAVVTGASSGIGREFVHALDGAYALDEIWVVARRADRLEELRKRCKTRIRVLELDLLDRASYTSYRQQLEQAKPEIAVLINAAGCGLFGAFADLPLEGQLDVIALNDGALTAFCHISLPYMTAGSSIVNLASNSSWQPVPYINVYGASKAYVLNFSRALGVELKGRGIHVMAVAPGWIKTEFFDHAVKDDTIRYYDRFYTAEQVVKRAMRDLKRRRQVSILGLPVRMQVRLVKLLPANLIMKIWCRQQGK